MPDQISPPSPTITKSPVNPLKRKFDHDDREHKPLTTTNVLPVGVNVNGKKGEYEAGEIICDKCGESVSFRDDDGEFTLKHWDPHRQACVGAGPSSSVQPVPVIYPPEAILATEMLSHPQTKRRRAKRTEEERIEYLRADNYVAQFEAYRVLCASCDKWIRLRPNSTYCSIPWDAHRKSCLAKKINSKNVYALEERSTLFSKDPDVRKFDAERVLCNMCDTWIGVPSEDHMQAVHKWLEHRGSCQKASSSSTIDLAPAPIPEQPIGSPSLSSLVPPTASRFAPPHLESPSSFHDLTPSNYAPAHESRRRNAEQRAATLRADTLIGEVEPNRVFCSLCKKWVQLRQDSSYCAYPWLQHRGKCLARHERRAQKAVEMAELKGKKHAPMEEDELASEEENVSDDLESEEVLEAHLAHERRREAKRTDQRHRAHKPKPRSSAYSAVYSHGHSNGLSVSGSARHPHGYGHVHGHGHGQAAGYRGRGWAQEDDAEGDADAEGDSFVEDEHPPRTMPRGRRPWPIGLADLDSPAGRKQFISASIDYLFATTYETTDDMRISALLTYLNAAMPLDKHEDFDTSEVVRAVTNLHEKGRLLLQGDLVRPVE